MSPREVPASIGKYRVLSVLGEGAMGVVYRAHDPSIDREVAIKTIRRQMLSDNAVARMMMERFRREAMAAGRLSHPGIVAVYDYGEADDAAFIVMELAPGESLHERVERLGWVPLAEVGRLMAQLLDALGYAHERGVVHRDVKPGNVLVSSGGQLKITDFGIARIESSNLTHTGVAVGTPSYMAPEQYAGGAIDHRVDLFAVGVMLYELVTGVRPFGGETLESLAYQVVHAPHLAPTQRVPSLPPRLDAVLSTALAKRADARYSTAAEFARGLSRALADAPAHEGTGFAATMLANGAASAPSKPRSSSSAWVTTDALLEIERSLTAVLGPVAGALVRRSAARAMDVTGFLEALCQNAATSADRTRIEEVTRSVLGRSSATQLTSTPASSGTRFVGTSGPGTTALTAAGLLPSEDIERVVAELARAVGPIARVLVKKALPKATDLRSLCELVALGIDHETERAKFLKAMKVA